MRMTNTRTISTITTLIIFIGLLLLLVLASTATGGSVEAASASASASSTWATPLSSSIAKNKKKKKQYSVIRRPALSVNNDECSLVMLLSSRRPLRGGAAAVATKTKRPAATVSAAAAAIPPSALLVRLKIGFYFALWYALNIIYNILNKKVLNTWPAPLTVGTMQFGVGCLYANLIWMLQLRGTRPRLFNSKPIHAVGFWHAVGQLTSMVSLGAGPVSFTHIVKALEPFFSAIVSALIFGQVMNPVVYATLLPVVGGVGYACLKERSFSWLAFWMAMASNVAFALRAVLSKVAMASSSNTSSSIGTNLTPTNVFGLVTESAFWISIPIALVGEGLGIRQSWADATKTQNGVELLKAIVVSGFFHYVNNEVMYLALDSVHPVTLAVGNTMKRIFIMVASVMVFRNEITTQAAIGSAIGIGGVLLYSLTKQHYEKLEALATTSSSSSATRTTAAAKESKKATTKAAAAVAAAAAAAVVATKKGEKKDKKKQ